MLKNSCPEISKYYGAIPLCLPHYRIKNDKLFFMNFREKKVDKDQINVLKKIDGKNTVRDILKDNPEIKFETLLNLEKNKILLFHNPSSSIDKTGLNDMVIISPHADDSIFSLGGTLWKFRNKFNIYIINVFTRQDFTIYWKLYEESRENDFVHKEENLAWKLLNIKNGKMLGFADAPMRKNYKNDVIISEELDSSEIISKEERLYKKLTASFAEIINKINPSLILCPLGIGKHVDHILSRDACIDAVDDYNTICFYEEMPYVISFKKESIIEEVEEKIKRKLVRRQFDITSSIDMKYRLVNIYKSQIKAFQAKSMVAHSYRDSKYFEYIWRSEAKFKI